MSTSSQKKVKAPADPHELVRFVEDLKRQWMATIDALVDPLMIVDGDYNVLKANVAMANRSESTVKGVLGKKCYKILANKKKPCQGCQLKDTFDSGDPREFELKLSGKNQLTETSVFEVSSQAIVDRNGNIEQVVHVYRDRTEARALREKLLQSEKLNSIGMLAGGVAHEINNPLGGVLIFAEMLKKELPPESPHVTDVDEILKAANRCKVIVSDLLAFARTNPYRKPGKVEHFSLKDAITSALKFAKVNFKAKRMEIHEEFTVDFDVPGTRNKMIQLFLNLIQNAEHAMQDGGALSLRTYEDSTGNIVAEVEDTGKGIPESIKDRVFDPFFTTKDVGQGTGLGLAICFGLAGEFQGELDFESEEGVGTIFRLLIPKNPE